MASYEKSPSCCTGKWNAMTQEHRGSNKQAASERRREEVQASLSKAREQSGKYRAEDREFRQCPLVELERHNRVLESILARLEKLL